jgi:nucleotide-binding universal stress UspA family protein
MSRIIVGVDGSEHGSVALRWATRRAERSDEEVVALLAWTFFDQGYRPPGEDLRPAFDDDDAKRVLAEAVEAAGVTGPVTQQTVQDPAPEAIVDAAEPHDLIVVGARGLGGFKGLLLGSVSNRVLELARCPVVVIHGEPAIVPDGEIVVGVDGSEESLVALRWAAAEATATGAPVRIVHAWQVPIYAEMATPQVLTALEEEATNLVAKVAEDPALAGVNVARDVACDGAAHALLAHDVDASMLVVATRGHGALKRLLLGSTSRQVAQHATSPVVVVPGKR